MADNASMRDELRVQTAMITRLDGTVAGLVQEVRATRRILPGRRLASRQVSSRGRLCAVLISEMWEKAWGKFPSRRCPAASYSSDESDAETKKPLEQTFHLFGAAEQAVSIREPEAASEEAPSPGGRPSCERVVR